jgi:hypothetical protein
VSRIRQGFVELNPTDPQRVRLGPRAGLSRVVENFCLELVKTAMDQQAAEKTYGVPDDQLTPIPWSAMELERAWREATVRDRAGRWRVALQVEVDRSDINARRQVRAAAPTFGVDLGLTTFATVVDDDGTVTEILAPKGLAAAQRRLRRANKALARSRRDSANRVKARTRLVCVHLKVAHRRADFLHKTKRDINAARNLLAAMHASTPVPRRPAVPGRRETPVEDP